MVPVVVLAGNTGRLLPIFIGISEAVSIKSAQDHSVYPRPFTHDLFLEVLTKFGIRVVALQIDAINEGVYFAQLVLSRDQGEVRVDCRPSDGIALALRASAPVSVEQDILDTVGQEANDLPPLMDLDSVLRQ